MAGKLSGNAIASGITIQKLNSELQNIANPLKVFSITYPDDRLYIPTIGLDLNASIQLIGSGFDSNANVFVDHSPAANVNVANSNFLTFTVLKKNVNPGAYILQIKNPDGASITVPFGIKYDKAHFQGTTSGYASGGRNITPVPSFVTVNNIDKFPFATDSNATDVGDLSQAKSSRPGGQSSAVNGYTSGGLKEPPTPIGTTVVDRFPFATDTNATNIGDLSNIFYDMASQSSTTNAYMSGGEPPARWDLIEKFSFASGVNIINVGELSQRRRWTTGQSSAERGYTSGGFHPPPVSINTATIDRFPFATDTNAAYVGNLTQARTRGAGQSSDVSGYTSGGVIDKFSFASDANATNVGNNFVSGNFGQSSTVSGYTSGSGIDKFPFATDTNAAYVGDLTLERYEGASQQV